MKLNELLENFQNKNQDVLLNIQELQVVPQPNVLGFVRKGYCIVYKNANGGIEVKNVFVIVKNLGKEDEEAFWENNEPILVPSQIVTETVKTFTDKIKDWLNAAIENGKIYGGTVEQVDEDTKVAIVKLIIEKEETGTCQEKKVCVREVENKLESKEIE